MREKYQVGDEVTIIRVEGGVGKEKEDQESGGGC